MKKCEKCGVPQKDSNFRCIECGAILGEPLSREEESTMKKKISDFKSKSEIFMVEHNPENPNTGHHSTDGVESSPPHQRSLVQTAVPRPEHRLH